MAAGLLSGMILSNLGQLAADLRRDMIKAKVDFARAIQLATKESGSGLKLGLRLQLRGAGLGARMEKTWQDEVFPKGRDSPNAAVIVFSKAPDIISAFDRGGYIKAKGGIFLAIPTKNAPRRGMDGKKLTPANWPNHRLGKLRIVRTRNALLLVADDLRASFSKKDKKLRGFKKASKSAIAKQKGLTTVVMFILVQQSRMPKKLDVDREFKKWAAAYPVLIERNLKNAHRS